MWVHQITASDRYLETAGDRPIALTLSPPIRPFRISPREKKINRGGFLDGSASGAYVTQEAAARPQITLTSRY